MKIVLGCRHGEALKNLKNVYGGDGSALTEVGVNQVKVIAENIKMMQQKLGLPVKLYISCNRIHIVESAKIMQNILNIKTINQDSDFKPIRLGVFDGMSRQKQEELYPNACEAHKKWEQGLIDIKESECLVEGMQPASDYVKQMIRFLNKLEDGHIHILVGTRSDMSCLENIFNNQSPDRYMEYKYYDFKYTQMTMAKIENDKIIKITSQKQSNNSLTNNYEL